MSLRSLLHLRSYFLLLPHISPIAHDATHPVCWLLGSLTSCPWQLVCWLSVVARVPLSRSREGEGKGTEAGNKEIRYLYFVFRFPSGFSNRPPEQVRTNATWRPPEWCCLTPDQSNWSIHCSFRWFVSTKSILSSLLQFMYAVGLLELTSVSSCSRCACVPVTATTEALEGDWIEEWKIGRMDIPPQHSQCKQCYSQMHIPSLSKAKWNIFKLFICAFKWWAWTRKHCSSGACYVFERISQFQFVIINWLYIYCNPKKVILRQVTL